MTLPVAFAALVLAAPHTASIPAALAAAGAPAATPVTCTTAVPQGEYGWAQWAPSASILLQPDVCGGLEWLQDDDAGRAELERAAPFLGYVGQAGVSALVTLHEATHIAGMHDETDTECRALALLPAFLGQYLDGPALEQAERTAGNYDASLPALYHQHGCTQ